MKKEFIIILTGLITMGCSQGDTNQVNNQQTINKYSFSLSSKSAFLVGGDLGASFYNDITVGVINHTSNSIKLLTSAGNQTVIFTGSDIEHISSVKTIITPNLSSGVYVVKIKTKDTITVKKIVLK